ncbi:hypothetical protein GP486_006834 [Trichoglossum hirsutum]|uniref:Uncharacterized protein n=1 Tax=Trichoglossum hirsutum TaxID=265104 RepID=A0A9P8ID03_9PEZI|nr:hypothetical protein GP486_006834 [Trichoglossum hirsutum]
MRDLLANRLAPRNKVEKENNGVKSKGKGKTVARSRVDSVASTVQMGTVYPKVDAYDRAPSLEVKNIFAKLYWSMKEEEETVDNDSDDGEPALEELKQST